MNIVLRVLQVVLGLHTLTGAVWKASNAESRVPSLAALPHAVWLGLGVVEVACAFALMVSGLVASAGRWVPAAAGFVVAEMLLFTAVHTASGSTEQSQVVYWLVVAGLSAFVALGRASLARRRA
jgi:hypothetical protein